MMSMTEMLSMTDSELEKTVLTQKLGQFLDILMSMKFVLNQCYEVSFDSVITMYHCNIDKFVKCITSNRVRWTWTRTK